MDERLETIIAAVIAWQRHPMLRPLLCAANHTHRPLVPSQLEGRVVLCCPDCEYRQSYIPSSVMHAFSTGATGVMS